MIASEDPKSLRVLALPGSLRRTSYNRGLLEAARTRAPSGMSITILGDLGSVPLFSEDLERAAPGPESVRRLRRQVEACDGLLIATPEYNQSIPGVLKNVIDWLSRPSPDEVLVGKPVAIMGATVGPWGTRFAQSALRHVLNATESLVLPGPPLYVRSAATLFDDAGRLVDPKTLDTLQRVLEAFATWIETLRTRASADASG